MSASLIPKALLTHQTVIAALKPHNIKARFLFILEMKGDEGVPRWAVGGSKSKVFPTYMPVAELKEINSFDHADVDIPPGWSKLHHFIYILGAGRDEHGWEYRSTWSNGKPADDEEQWKDYYQINDVQRRVWMTVAVKSEDLSNAKVIVSAYLTSQVVVNRRLLKGDNRRKEPGFILGTAWNTRELVLSEDKIQVFPTPKVAQEEAERIAAADALPGPKAPIEDKPFDINANEIPLRFVSFTRMYGAQVGAKSDYVCSLKDKRSDNIACILDFADVGKWKKWIIPLHYCIAVNSPELEFTPFDYGPPCDDLAPHRVLVFGHLEKLGHFRTNWKKRFFTLTSFELIYFKNEDVMGRLALDGARLLMHDRDEKDEETSCTFGIATPTDQVLVMRALSVRKRRYWESYIKNQIELLAHVNKKYNLRQDKVRKLASIKSIKSMPSTNTEEGSMTEHAAGDGSGTAHGGDNHDDRSSIAGIMGMESDDEDEEDGGDAGDVTRRDTIPPQSRSSEHGVSIYDAGMSHNTRKSETYILMDDFEVNADDDETAEIRVAMKHPTKDSEDSTSTPPDAENYGIDPLSLSLDNMSLDDSHIAANEA